MPFTRNSGSGFGSSVMLASEGFVVGARAAVVGSGSGSAVGGTDTTSAGSGFATGSSDTATSGVAFRAVSGVAFAGSVAVWADDGEDGVATGAGWKAVVRA